MDDNGGDAKLSDIVSHGADNGNACKRKGGILSLDLSLMVGMGQCAHDAAADNASGQRIKNGRKRAEHKTGQENASDGDPQCNRRVKKGKTDHGDDIGKTDFDAGNRYKTGKQRFQITQDRSGHGQQSN